MKPLYVIAYVLVSGAVGSLAVIATLVAAASVYIFLFGGVV